MKLEEFPVRLVRDGRMVLEIPQPLRDRKAYRRAWYQKILSIGARTSAPGEQRTGTSSTPITARGAPSTEIARTCRTSAGAKKSAPTIASTTSATARGSGHISAPTQRRTESISGHSSAPPGKQITRGGLQPGGAPPRSSAEASPLHLKKNAAELRARPLTTTQFSTGTNP